MSEAALALSLAIHNSQPTALNTSPSPPPPSTTAPTAAATTTHPLAVPVVPDALPPPPSSSVTNGIPANDSLDNGALSSAPDSPAIPSPPPNNDASPAVKIDLGYARESDARHEPLSTPIQKQQDDISVRPQIGTPLDPSSIPIDPPHGTPPPSTGHLLEDVQMAEQPSPAPTDPPSSAPLDSPSPPNGVNGVNGFKEEDTPTPNGINGHASPPSSAPVPVDDQDQMSVDVQTPLASTSRLSDPHDMDGVINSDQPPPFKRARTNSDADMSPSVIAQLIKSPAVPPPPTTAASSMRRSPTPSPPSERRSTLTREQWRFCCSTVRNLRKLKDAMPFLNPVDPVALNIPHYPNIVKHPMDFQTVDRKLASSNPQKPDSNPHNPRYLNSDEFVSDVRLMFFNAELFNGKEHAVTQMGKRVESIFDKQIKSMPAPAPIEPEPPKKVETPEPVSVPVKKAAAHQRRPSTSVPTIRRSEAVESASAPVRPKREIHPPPPKDLPYAETSKKMRSVRKAKIDNGAEEQMKFCGKVLAELHKKQYFAVAEPFYEPVDIVKLGIPHYPKIVKRPMDLGTMRRKLEGGEYPNPEKFKDDFDLMIRNCKAFNPPGTVVHDAGSQLERVFYSKWAGLPPLRPQQSEYEEEEEEEEEDLDEARAQAIRNEISSLQADLHKLEQKISKKKKKEKKPAKRVSPPVASSSKASKPPKPTKKRSSKKHDLPGEDVLSFEQKKDLSETIQQLDGDKLEKVIHIIHEGVPEIRDSSEEIELDIDTLPAPVLQKLYNFVIRPLKPSGPKRSRVGTGTGTGGLKRKSMDEDVEAEKIRQLEERMRMFDKSGGGSAMRTAAAAAAARHADDSEHSSDESSSESSGSDSE